MSSASNRILQDSPLNRFGVGTPQHPWRALPNPLAWSASSAALVAAGTYCHNVALPASDVANGLFVLFPANECNQIALRFAAARNGNSPDGLTATGRLWLLGQSVEGNAHEVPGEYQGDLTLTAGGLEIPANSVYTHPTSGYQSHWVDTIEVSPDRSLGGIEITGSDGDNAIAEMLVDLKGNRGLAVQLLKGENIDALLVMAREV